MKKADSFRKKISYSMRTFLTLFGAIIFVAAMILFINFIGYVLDIPGGMFN